MCLLLLLILVRSCCASRFDLDQPSLVSVSRSSTGRRVTCVDPRSLLESGQVEALCENFLLTEVVGCAFTGDEEVDFYKRLEAAKKNNERAGSSGGGRGRGRKRGFQGGGRGRGGRGFKRGRR